MCIRCYDAFIHIEVTFGFDPVQYRVNEDAGTVTLFVMLLDGSLEKEVNLQFSIVEGTAMASGIVKINLVYNSHLRDTNVQFGTYIVVTSC